MEGQNQIKRCLSEAAAIVQIRSILAQGEAANRTALATELCTRYGFHDARGRPQLGGCLKALGELAASGQIELPASRSQPRRGSPRRLPQPVAPPVGLPDTVTAVADLELVLVSDDRQQRLWNELMFEHPCGPGPLVGPQLRYLIGSAHGWLGGFGFAAAALKLRDRDAWIGWDQASRARQLHRVLNMSRFLLRAGGCHNLASHLLARVIHRVADDFECRFGYRPYLLESFVDGSQFDGGCYRAANFVRVGQSQGRGRQDAGHQRSTSRKDIYVYPLTADFRQRLGVSAPGLPPLAAGAGLDSEQWAVQEFGDAPLGDRRLSQRLVASAASLAQQPGRAFTAVAQSDVAAVKGYYRLIDRADLEAVTMATILAPHQARTQQRMAQEAQVLCIADGTTLDYTSLAECEGLGITGTNQTGAVSRGIALHSTLAVNPDGIPLGIVDVRCRTPQPAAQGQAEGQEMPLAEAQQQKEKKKPLAARQSYDWIAGLNSCLDLAAQLPATRITCVMDREADFFELFDARRANPRVELLVRAKHNRQTTTGVKLFDRLRGSGCDGTMRLTVKRQSARPKLSKQKARAARPQRTAYLELRYQQVTFAPPEELKDKAPLTLSVVHAWETQPAEGVKPLEWCLLTSREIGSPSDAERCLVDYALRWRIEDWHRVLKTGCRVEDLAHQRLERLERAIAINLVIAWRLMVMTLLGREVPELPAEVLFSEVEIKVLSAWAGTVRAKPPANLGEAVLLVARIGGYLNRNNDPPPGHELMWHGYQNLTLMCMGFALNE